MRARIRPRESSPSSLALASAALFAFAALACGDSQPAAGGDAFDASAHDSGHPMNDASSLDGASMDSSVDAIADSGGSSRDAAFGVDTSNALVRFSITTPGSITKTPITGLQTGETIVGIDVRPSNGRLYGLGSTSRLYTIDTTIGVATAISAVQFSSPLNGLAFGFDVDPVADRIRVDGDTGMDLRLDPDTGAVAATDTALSYAIGDLHQGAVPHITGNAYTLAATDGGAALLYAIDTGQDSLAIQTPPNGGVLTTIGPLGVDIGDGTGFDIHVESGADRAYVASTAGGTTSNLYTIDLHTGALTLVGAIGGAPLRAFALTP